MEKLKTMKANDYAIKYSQSTCLLSALMTYVKNISNWSDPGGSKMGYELKLFTFTA